MDLFNFLADIKATPYCCVALANRCREKGARQDKNPDLYKISMPISDVGRVCQEILLLYIPDNAGHRYLK